MKEIRSSWVYLLIAAMAAGYYCYASYNGLTYFGDKVTRNTEYNHRGRTVIGAYGTRFYHK